MLVQVTDKLEPASEQCQRLYSEACNAKQCISLCWENTQTWYAAALDCCSSSQHAHSDLLPQRLDTCAIWPLRNGVGVAQATCVMLHCNTAWSGSTASPDDCCPPCMQIKFPNFVALFVYGLCQSTQFQYLTPPAPKKVRWYAG